jgi:hypothetical protein
MHMPDLQHEFGIRPHILAQVVICCVHKVTEFAPWDVVRIIWKEFRLNVLFEEFPCVAMGLPFLLPHHPPPSGGIALQIRLGKFHGWVPPNLGGMKIIFHLRNPSIHNLFISYPIKVPKFCGLESHTFRWSSFEGRK